MASPAQAFSLNWSFNGTDNGGTGQAAALGTVSGTISGLQDNTTNTSGLTATVLTTPDGRYQGVTFNTVETGGITVAGGVVTSSDVAFINGSRILGFDYLLLGLASGLNYPIYSTESGYTLMNPTQPATPLFGGGTTFSSATPVPFEFDPSFGLVALGGIWAGRKVIKKIKTSKKSV